MNSNIGTGSAQNETRDGSLILTTVRGLRRARIRPSVRVCTVLVGRKMTQSSWNVATNTDGYRNKREINGMINMAGTPLTKTVKYGRNLSNICTNMYLMM